MIEIKIDPTTIPADMQKVIWQTYEDINSDKWKHGRFISEERIFTEGFEDVSTSFDSVFDVHHWEPYRKIKS